MMREEWVVREENMLDEKRMGIGSKIALGDKRRQVASGLVGVVYYIRGEQRFYKEKSGVSESACT